MHIALANPSETLLPIQATTCHLEPRTPAVPAPTPKHLYFAYGSNLSPTQMRQRCTANPALSATPLAIAILPAWKWHICERGYANVLPPPSLRTRPQQKLAAQVTPGGEDVVYGVLYEMDARDEDRLDCYEGVDPSPELVDVNSEDDISREVRPWEQGEGCYNKWYVRARVVRWLGAEEHVIRAEGGEEVPVLVYVNEEQMTVGPAKTGYIVRMNRGIAEAEALGLSRGWVEEVMRPFIPAISR